MVKLCVFALLPLVGCAVGGTLPPLTRDHPASPQAAEAPLAPMSETLALPERRSAPAATTRESATSLEMPAAGGGRHAHH